MKKPLSSRLLQVTLAACAAAVVCLALYVRPAWAGVEPEPFRTGLFGIAPGQAVRISVLNTGEASGTINPCVRVSDAAGRLLVDTDSGPVMGGTGTFVDFTPVPEDGIPPPAGRVPADARVQVRVEVEILSPVPDDGLPVPEDGHPARRGAARLRRVLRHVMPTVEVFDVATGRTVFTMPFAEVAFNPQPEPPEPIRQVR
jgi:hypothetical protein